MLGAVAGPLLALALLHAGVDVRLVIALSLAPSLLSLLSFVALVRDRPVGAAAPGAAPRARLPRLFWLFLAGVLLFGLGDFSRTFLVLLAVRAAAGAGGETALGAVPLAVLLYALHNGVSAVAALGSGHLGDRHRKILVLAGGYAIGVGTNLVLAVGAANLVLLTIAVALSGVYVAVEETIEKATAAEMLPRELRSLGLGVLASANAVGDMASSLYVGLLIDGGHARTAFLVAAGCGTAGLAWTATLTRRASRFSRI